jgi:HK97 family phage major capsid protein
VELDGSPELRELLPAESGVFPRMPPLSEQRRLRELKSSLLTEANDLIPSKGGYWSDERREKFDRLIDEHDSVARRLQTIEGNGAPPNPQIEDAASALRRLDARDNEYRSAFRNYLKNGLYADQYGFKGVSDNDRELLTERRDMGTGGGNALQGPGGGYFVPVGFVYDVEQAMKFYGEMLMSSTIMQTASGQPLPHPTSNDTSVLGELIGEGQQVTAQDVTIGSIIYNAYKYSTRMVKVSVELLQDSAFDIEKFLKEQFAERLGRVLNVHFTTGTGVAQPTGIIPAATAGPTAIGSSGNDGGSGTAANSIGSDDLVALEHSVDRLYRKGAAWMMHDSTLKFVKQLKDKYGRPLWLPSLSTNSPETILGYPYFVNNDMDTISTAKKTVLFGQLKKYLIRQVREMSVLRLVERFADYGQVAFLGFARYDGNLLDAGTHPVKYLVQG